MPISETASASPEQWRSVRLQHWVAVEIPDYPHSGWSSPRNRGRPGKPSPEPLACSVSWSPLSLGPGYSTWLTMLAASTFLILILPALYSVASVPPYPTPPHPTATAPTNGISQLRPNPGATSQFLVFLWLLIYLITIISAWEISTLGLPN